MSARHFYLLVTGILLPLVLLLIVVWPIPRRLVDPPWQLYDWPPTDHSPLDPNQGAILSPEAASDFFPTCSRSQMPLVLRYWTPRPEQIRRIDSTLPAYFPLWDSDPRLNPFGHSHDVRAYHRQYMGLVGLDGHAFILINAFANDYLERSAPWNPGSTWRTSPFQVCDGADSFWSVEADPITGAFRAFGFDGSA